MATVPLSGTDLRLMRNVPFHSDYKNSRWFTSKSSQTTYFTGKPVVHRMNNKNFQRIEGYNFVAVDKHIDELWGTNYLMFQNADYGNKWFYAFVTTMEYKQKNNTHVYFEIDVLQTWMFDMDFKPSFVEREHCKLWESDGSPVINTLDEGLDYGTEYDTVQTFNVRPPGLYKWMVLVSKEKLGQDEDGQDYGVTPSVVGTPQPLFYYVIPFRDDGHTPNAMISGQNTGFTFGDPIKILEAFAKGEEIVNMLVSIYITDWIGLDCGYNSNDDRFDFPKKNDNQSVGRTGIVLDGSNQNILRIDKLHRFTPLIQQVFKDKYSSVQRRESKLLMHPYTTLTIDNFKGNRVDYRLEYVSSKNIEVTLKGSIGTSNFTSTVVNNYNLGDNVTNVDRISNEYALIDNNPNDVPVLNDALAAFLQGNRNSIRNQKSMADLSGKTAVASGLIGMGASVASRNPAGLASSAVSGISGMASAKLQIEGINAKQHDISNVPPQISNMGSNTAYNYGNGYNGVYVMVKQIKPEYIKKLSHFFNMFGYKISEVKVPNFRTRKSWNYIQTVSCVILGNFNNEDLQALKNIFDNGITLWHTDDVGNYSLDNGVR